MRRLILFISYSLFFIFVDYAAFAQTSEIKIEGVYLGRNLFLRNPLDPATREYCIKEIYLNNELKLSAPEASAIQVPMENLKLKQDVVIRIVHKDNCKPEVVNPEVIKSSSSFNFLYVQIDENSINWATSGETLKGEYIVEHQTFKGWEEVIKREGKGDLGNNQYSTAIKNYAGENHYRVIYYPENSEPIISEDIEYFSLLKPVSYYPVDSVTDWISLTRETDYFILNQDGEILKSGHSHTINVSDLDYGEYRIVVENEEDYFFKPKPKIVRTRKKKGDNQ